MVEASARCRCGTSVTLHGSCSRPLYADSTGKPVAKAVATHAWVSCGEHFEADCQPSFLLKLDGGPNQSQ